MTFVDSSRPTDVEPHVRRRAGPHAAGAHHLSGRGHGRLRLSQLAAQPARRAGPFPLVVFSHGFTASGPAYGEVLLRRIAAHGYVVAAPTFPLSNGNGARRTEARRLRQPARGRQLRDRRDARDEPAQGPAPRAHRAQGDRRDGPLARRRSRPSASRTTVRNADRRIKAAVPMSGMQLPFPGGTWTWPRVPLLLVHGDHDGTVPYAGQHAGVRRGEGAEVPADAARRAAHPVRRAVPRPDRAHDRQLLRPLPPPRASTRWPGLEQQGTVPGVSTLESASGCC